MQKADCDSSLVHRPGVLAGAAQFTKNPDEEVRRKLHDVIVDLWTGSGKHCEKAEAAAQSGDKKGEYAFRFEFEHELSATDIKEELPPDLAEADAKHDLVIAQPSPLAKPTEWEFRLKFWQTRDRIYKAMMEGRRDGKKRKREEEVKDEEAPAPPAWATALTWKCADGVERTLLDRQLIYRGIFDAPAAAGEEAGQQAGGTRRTSPPFRLFPSTELSVGGQSPRRDSQSSQCFGRQNMCR